MTLTYPLVVGLAMGIWESDRDSMIARRQWTTTGVVTAWDRSNHNQCRYVFSLQGKSFEGQDSALRDPQPFGEIVRVYYDSSNPSVSGLEDYTSRGKREGGLTPMFVFGIVLVPLVILFNKIRNSSRQRRAS